VDGVNCQQRQVPALPSGRRPLTARRGLRIPPAHARSRRSSRSHMNYKRRETTGYALPPIEHRFASSFPLLPPPP
ncbi:hypothetical protein HGM15179_010795, partial [Zosterops borbonicus]